MTFPQLFGFKEGVFFFWWYATSKDEANRILGLMALLTKSSRPGRDPARAVTLRRE